MNFSTYGSRLILGFVLFSALSAVGCITKSECEKQITQARQEEREWANARVEAANAKTEKVQAEAAKDREAASAELERVRTEAAAKAKQERLTGFVLATQGQTIDSDIPLEQPSLLSKVVFWLCGILTVAALAAATIFLILDNTRLTQFCKALAVLVSVYLSWRFLTPLQLTGNVLKLSITYELLAETILLIVGFVLTWLFHYMRGRRRLATDYIGIVTSVAILLHVISIYANSELLLALGSLYAVKLAVAAPIGGITYFIYAYGGKVIGNRSKPSKGPENSDEKADYSTYRPGGYAEDAR